MFSYWLRYVGVGYLFLLFQLIFSCILSSADVYILYHVLLCIHSIIIIIIIIITHAYC
jgi:hypothetical protein